MFVVEIALLTLMGLCFVLLLRNSATYRFSMKCIDAIAAYERRRIDTHDWSKPFPKGTLYDVFSRVSYGQMVIQFWRPFLSFYEGTPLADLLSIEDTQRVDGCSPQSGSPVAPDVSKPEVETCTECSKPMDKPEYVHEELNAKLCSDECNTEWKSRLTTHELMTIGDNPYD